MPDEKPIVNDVLGIAPYGEALKIATEESIKGASAFLSKICSPAAEEFGLFLQDKVKTWRLNNLINVIEKSKNKLEFKDNQLQIAAHPRVVMEVIDKASWQENENLQEMWAGLLVNSCREEGSITDENIIYINILNQLTNAEANILNYYAEKSEKTLIDGNIIKTKKGILLTAEYFFKIAGTNDVDKLSSEINHLISLRLVETGFGLASGFYREESKEENKDESKKPLMVGLKLSALAIILYVKCQGYKGTAKDFFSVEYDPTAEEDYDE